MNNPIPEPLRGADVISWAQPVTRALNALGDKVGAAARNERDRRGSSPLPWSFYCKIEEGEDGEEQRSGGWTNCRLQIGMAIDWHSPDLSHAPSDTHHVISGTDLCDDGDYYLEITLANGEHDPNNDIDRRDDAAEIKVAGEGETVPSSDYVDGIIRIPLGTVVDGEMSGYTPHLNPVVYKFL